MCPDWYESEDAREQVRALLRRSGLVLELEVEAICCEVAGRWDKALEPNLQVSSDQITYALRDQPFVYRDIDQVFTFYEELELGEHTGLQLTIRCPIECKFRKDVQHFAFVTSGIMVNLPVEGFVGSQLLANALATALLVFDKVPQARVESVIIRDGATPQTVCDERLVFTAGSALYDFIESESEGHDIGRSKPNDLLRDELRKFYAYLKRKRYHWPHVLADRIRKLKTAAATQYYAENFKGGRTYSLLTIDVPILCLEGHIFSVPSTQDMQFTQVPTVLTSIRKQGWPTKPSYRYYSAAGDVPIIVTNLGGLSATLGVVKEFALAVRKALLSQPVEIERRWPLEHNFYMNVCAVLYDSEEERYRSDFNFPIHP